MIIIQIFPFFDGYIERIKSLIAIADVDHYIILITKNNIPITIDTLHVSIRHANGKKKGLGFMLFALHETFKAVKAASIETPITIHDHFFPRVGLITKLMFKKHVIHTVISFYASNYALLKSRGWRINSQPRSLTCEFHYFSMLLSRIISEWIAVKSYDAITGNSQEILDNFIHYFKMLDKKGYLLQTAVDTTFYQPRTVSTARSKKCILSVGRILLRRKGIDTILNAFTLVCKERNDCVLHLVGDIDPYDKKEFYAALQAHPYKDKIQTFKAVSRAGLREHYQNADVFISASINEGSPRTVKEALSCDIPSIVSDIPGHRSIDPNGEVLQFFTPSDTSALYLCVTELLTSKIKPLPGACRSYIDERFKVERVAMEFRRIYQLI
jgi:glycosyltransferase involved in cell wall biosynthesis